MSLNLRMSQFGLSLIGLTLLASPSSFHAQDDAANEITPLAEWISAGEQEDFDWDVDIENPRLRIDQHFEIAVTARVEAGDLGEATEDHELALVTVVTADDGTWLGVSEPERETLPSEVDEDTGVEFETYVSLLPGRYVIWVVLHDETTGERSVKRERKEVDDIGNDPLPGVYADFPAVEFAHVEHAGALTVRQFDSGLIIPISSSRPLDVELVATISAPEQWSGGGGVTRHIENLLGGLRALSQMDPVGGAVSITGLDLLRRSVVYEDVRGAVVDWTALMETFEQVNRSALSVDALLGREENAAFLRDYVYTQASTRFIDRANPPGPEDPLKVMIIVAGVMRFDDDADKSEISLEGECDCRLFHVRFKQNRGDLFDQLDDVLEPFDPPTFDVTTAQDFRKVIGEIVEALESAEE